MNQYQPKRWLAPLLIAAATILLYGPYLDNPLVFDDQYFFMAGHPEKFVAQGFSLTPRWLAYYSHGLTFTLLGTEIYLQRIGNMILHACTGIALYAFILCLLTTTVPTRTNGPKPETAAAFAALLFVLHPAAVYAAGYLIQRTIVMATMFCILSWTAFWKGINGSRTMLWLSTPLFMLAALSKEHVVMTPIISALLCLAACGNRNSTIDRPDSKLIAFVLLSQAAISMALVLITTRVIGHAYEPMVTGTVTPEFTQLSSQSMLFPLSVLTQFGLFFKYMALWIIPNGAWMSVDMREPFIVPPVSPGAWLCAIAFILYPIVLMLVWLKYRRTYSIAISLLTPWILFSTEIATVRIQEIFVIYRSYLWMPGIFFLVALGFSKLEKHICVGIGFIAVFAFGAFSMNKLNTFSHSFHLWDEAASLAEKSTLGKVNSKPMGLARIYHNRGLSLLREGFIPNAIEDFNRALSLSPTYTAVYSDRGSAHLTMKAFDQALADFSLAAELDRQNGKYRAGRAAALRGRGDLTQGENEDRIACELGWLHSCSLPSKQQKAAPESGFGKH